jgi:hypothetical protein
VIAGINGGAFSTPEKLAAWTAQNKRELRGSFGGQGINNIERVAGMYRRAKTGTGGPSMMTAAMNTGAPDFQAALRQHGVVDMESLASAAIINPALAGVLAQKMTTSVLPKSARNRVINALQGGVTT